MEHGDSDSQVIRDGLYVCIFKFTEERTPRANGASYYGLDFVFPKHESSLLELDHNSHPREVGYVRVRASLVLKFIHGGPLCWFEIWILFSYLRVDC